MIYIEKEELTKVLNRIKIFNNKLPKKYLDSFNNIKLRKKQHPLFFTLLNDEKNFYLQKAISSIKKYNKAKYYNKAIKKLIEDGSYLNHCGALAEIIVVGYYLNKFRNKSKIEVVWERNIPNSKKNIDITIIDKIKINIEITGIHEDERIREHFDLRYKIKNKITQVIEKNKEQKYSYGFSLFKQDEKEIVNWNDIMINKLIKFIYQVRKNGVGKYQFMHDNIVIAFVEINKLNKLKNEYAYSLDIWSGITEESKRIKNKILDKAKVQLPKNEYNFICIPTLSGFTDEIDFLQAFLGQEQYHIRQNIKKIRFSRKNNGTITLIEKRNLSPIYGLIYTNLDYSKKKIIINPLKKVSKSIINTIQ